MATFDELKAKAAEIDSALADTRAQAKTGAAVAAVAILAATAISYLAGRRRGGKRRAVVEVYRA